MFATVCNSLFQVHEPVMLIALEAPVVTTLTSLSSVLTTLISDDTTDTVNGAVPAQRASGDSGRGRAKMSELRTN